MSEHWEPVIPYVYRRGALIERDSGDCGRWVNFDPSVDWVCEECSKYYKQKYEVTQDGITWIDSGLRRRGSLYQIDSSDCCIYRWVQIPITESYICDECGDIGNKWLAKYSTGSIAYATCDSSSTISKDEVPLTNSGRTTNPYEIQIGSCVTTIGAQAFENFRTVTSVTISDSVTTIEHNSFNRCYNLKNITIPSGVTSIGEYSFEKCSGITGVTVEASVPPRLWYKAFIDTNDCPIYVPCESVNAYKSASGWSTYADRITCLSLANVLVKLRLNDGNDVEFKSGKSSLNTSFCRAYTDTLVSAEITSACTSIGDYVFQDCSNISSVTISDSVTSIGENSFGICSNLKNVTIGSGVTSIGKNAFYDCDSFTNIVIPNSVTSIGSEAFRYCDSLKSVFIGSGVTSIGEYAFADCPTISGITIPNGVTNINDNTFKNCSGLTSVEIGSGVTSIGQWAFSSCVSLETITIYATTPPTLGLYAFNNTNLNYIYVPAESVDTYKSTWIGYASIIYPIS